MPQVEHRRGCGTPTSRSRTSSSTTGGWTLFDFDNCEHADRTGFRHDPRLDLPSPPEPRPRRQLPLRIGERWDAFLTGYRGVRPHVGIDADRLRQFPILREAIIYTHYCRTVDFATVRARRSARRWTRCGETSKRGQPPVSAGWTA